MKKNIFATLKHCASTDKKPNHEDCGLWCFYKKAQENNETPGRHDTHLGTYLRQDVINAIRPSYERLSQDELLKRCEGYLTQNANESLHNVLWLNMTKNKMFRLNREQYCAARGVTQFNLGAVAAQVEGIGKEGMQFTKRRDTKRKLAMNKMEEKKTERREKRQTTCRGRKEDKGGGRNIRSRWR